MFTSFHKANASVTSRRAAPEGVGGVGGVGAPITTPRSSAGSYAARAAAMKGIATPSMAARGTSAAATVAGTAAAGASRGPLLTAGGATTPRSAGGLAPVASYATSASSVLRGSQPYHHQHQQHAPHSTSTANHASAPMPPSSSYTYAHTPQSTDTLDEKERAAAVEALTSRASAAAIAKVESDDLAVLVYEARIRLARLRARRRAQDGALSAARARVVALRRAEAVAHDVYSTACDGLDAFMYKACEESSSVKELCALGELVKLRLAQDDLTIANLTDQLSALYASTSEAVGALRAQREEAEATRAHYDRLNAAACREGQRMREEARRLGVEIRMLEHRAHAQLLAHGQRLFGLGN